VGDKNNQGEHKEDNSVCWKKKTCYKKGMLQNALHITEIICKGILQDKKKKKKSVAKWKLGSAEMIPPLTLCKFMV